MINIGDTIPDISFEAFHNEDTKTMSLESFRGKWLILLFYPADFTFVCPTELKEAASLYSEFQKENAEIISISTDTVFVHKAWHDESEAIKGITFPMAADPTGNLCKAFGTYIEKEGLSLRGSFVIDPEGVLKAYEIHDNSIGRSGTELLRKIRAAKFVAEHGGEVCPANWRPGEATLKPGLDLVGKI
ncbi:redoxin domain-containing protein [Candidatus Peregrinibacteria bacterium]|jgi:NADH-dependent peroxiredoxin subunit C|nr:redoxin domain-containing protein [Candidatus Peregrinibacteria bacterium]MBT3598502.1 redoxin domain-containing protein [Candidatus Peregrinibacteria bacterium]MBT4366812.1 redoxin domain-containing protein [Candidatus Peregrinibacteria bacterium]MBT4585433.1 redoxin domain-containing protein [Candidatus Peregrinibacteria bacterium]MBT6730719.1 redoxin domain-containing protein [Candidatus Peregrinibacteria bacterium]